MRTIILALGLLLLSVSLARGQDCGSGCDLVTDDIVVTLDAEHAPIEWTDEVRLAAAQCLVAEARWRNRTEHSAILHILERRWRRYNRFHPDAPITFERQIRQYCHLHRSPEDSTSRWALSLPWGEMVEDPGFPSGVAWRNWVDDWDFVRETVTMFEVGALVDPLPRAMVFGGEMDGANAELLVYLGPTTYSIEDGARILLHNRFYALRSRIARDAAAVVGRSRTP